MQLTINTSNKYNLIDELNDKDMYSFFLRHALDVYLFISKEYNVVPSYKYITSMFNPLYGDSFNEEFVEVCRNHILRVMDEEDIDIDEDRDNVEEHISEVIESNYYELDIYYKDDLLMAWKEDLNLFFIDETQVESIQNIPFERVW